LAFGLTGKKTMVCDGKHSTVPHPTLGRTGRPCGILLLGPPIEMMR
jgi:hypothetical protein